MHKCMCDCGHNPSMRDSRVLQVLCSPYIADIKELGPDPFW
jgi:hypothetical protein